LSALEQPTSTINAANKSGIFHFLWNTLIVSPSSRKVKPALLLCLFTCNRAQLFPKLNPLLAFIVRGLCEKRVRKMWRNCVREKETTCRPGAIHMDIKSPETEVPT